MIRRREFITLLGGTLVTQAAMAQSTPKRVLLGYLSGTFETEAKPFIGVWNYGDNGDVAPWAIMPDTAAYSMDLNPAAKELITVDRGKLVVYRMPELFQ